MITEVVVWWAVLSDRTKIHEYGPEAVTVTVSKEPNSVWTEGTWVSECVGASRLQRPQTIPRCFPPFPSQGIVPFREVIIVFSLHRHGGAICRIQFKTISNITYHMRQTRCQNSGVIPYVFGRVGWRWPGAEHGFGATRAEMIYISPDGVRLGIQASSRVGTRVKTFALGLLHAVPA